jgi:hypothetical protein
MDPLVLKQYSNKMDGQGNANNNLAYSSWWNGENFQIEFHCPMSRRVPSTSQADGPKWVCDPHRLINNNNNNNNIDNNNNNTNNADNNIDKKSSKSCLIYSFGSNGKSEFEQGIKDVTQNSCEIHTFDMNTYNRRNGYFNESLKGISTFHSWGLGTEKQASYNPNTYKTLKQTMDILGHTNRVIDIFKIDCEWCEWTTYTQWINLDNSDNTNTNTNTNNTNKIDIRQILVETHNAPMPNGRDFFFNLHDNGYVIFSKEANYQNGAGGVEFAFLKLSTDFFINNTMYNVIA